MKLEIFKNYIKIDIVNSFIQLFKSFAETFISFFKVR